MLYLTETVWERDRKVWDRERGGNAANDRGPDLNLGRCGKDWALCGMRSTRWPTGAPKMGILKDLYVIYLLY